MLRNFFKSLGSIGIYIGAFAVPALLILYWAQSNLFAPADAKSTNTVAFQIDNGETIENVATRLESEGIIENASSISFITKYRMNEEQRKNLALVVGEYDLSPAMRPADILAKISTGDVVLHNIKVAAGDEIDDIAKAISDAGLLTTELADKALKDAETLRLLNIPAYIPEGFFFPAEYQATRTSKASQLVVKLLEESDKKREASLPNWKKRAEEIGFNSYDILKIASIIELEGGSLEEKRTLSSLYHNRLRIDLPLENDTVARYGNKELVGQPIPATVKEEDGPYNTYLRSALPPTPICSPSAESIEAALSPLDTDFLYKIGSKGKYDYSKSRREHVKKEKEYRKALLDFS